MKHAVFFFCLLRLCKNPISYFLSCRVVELKNGPNVSQGVQNNVKNGPETSR